mgnify:CR=1 FL=1
MNTKAICPECKNEIDLSRYPNLTKGIIIECNHCGMTLMVKDIIDREVKSEIVDEGK